MCDTGEKAAERFFQLPRVLQDTSKAARSVLSGTISLLAGEYVAVAGGPPAVPANGELPSAIDMLADVAVGTNSSEFGTTDPRPLTRAG